VKEKTTHYCGIVAEFCILRKMYFVHEKNETQVRLIIMNNDNNYLVRLRCKYYTVRCSVFHLEWRFYSATRISGYMNKFIILLLLAVAFFIMYFSSFLTSTDVLVYVSSGSGINRIPNVETAKGFFTMLRKKKWFAFGPLSLKIAILYENARD